LILYIEESIIRFKLPKSKDFCKEEIVMKIPESIKKIFIEDKAVAFGTATADGIPNINMIGIKKLLDDETIVLADNYFNKTFNNIKNNNKGTILTKRAEEKLWYQLKGTYTYINEGPKYEELKKWAKSVWKPAPARGMLIFKVENIFNCISGPNAGNLIDEEMQ